MLASFTFFADLKLFSRPCAQKAHTIPRTSIFFVTALLCKLNNNIVMFARVNNITDRLYAESAEIAYGTQRYTPAPPRQAFVGFEYKL